MATIEVQKIKLSIAIDGGALPRDILPPEGAPGSAKALVTLEIQSGSYALKATMKAKSYRDVLAKVDAAPHGAFAVLQGQLAEGGEIQAAGFTVQPIVLKEPTT